MTKAKLKELYKDWNIEINTAYHEDTSLKELMDLCESHGDGRRWCSWQKCLEEIIKKGNSGAIIRAFSIYDRYQQIQGAHEAWTKVARATNNMNI